MSLCQTGLMSYVQATQKACTCHIHERACDTLQQEYTSSHDYKPHRQGFHTCGSGVESDSRRMRIHIAYKPNKTAAGNEGIALLKIAQ